jgi:hypothetical protein
MWVGKSFGNDPMLIATNEAFRYLSGLLHLRSYSQLPPGTRIQEQNAQEQKRPETRTIEFVVEKGS